MENSRLKVKTSVLATATSAHVFLAALDASTVGSSWVHSALKISKSTHDEHVLQNKVSLFEKFGAGFAGWLYQLILKLAD